MRKKILLGEIPDQMNELRKQSRRVTSFGDDTRQLVTDMFDSMHAAKGIGLSAIQIGIDKQVMIAEYKESQSPVPKVVLINPKITWCSKKEVLDEEGCLSFPHIYGMVRRPEKIEYEAQDENGNVVSGKAGGLLARIIQHEFDHLNGVLFIDKVEGDLYTYEKEDDTEEL